MRILLLVLVLVAVGTTLVYRWAQPEEAANQGVVAKAVPVSAYRVQRQAFRSEISALGTLRAWESVDITANVAQIITAIGFEDGDSVERGDILALLKQDAEQATLRELQASLDDAQREVRRLEDLARRNQVAQTELDKARTRAQVLAHQIEGVEAAIADRTITAPFSGVLGLREVSEGALVTAGQRLTTLDDLDRMRLEFTVPSVQLALLQVGQPVLARSPAFRDVFRGQVTAIDSRVDPASRAISARAVFPNPEHRLRPGLLMEVTLQGEERPALLVPEESLQSRSLRHYVWRIADDGFARRVEVTLGGRKPGWVEVRSGLQEGNRVVRDGVGKLGGEQMPVRTVGS